MAEKSVFGFMFRDLDNRANEAYGIAKRVAENRGPLDISFAVIDNKEGRLLASWLEKDGYEVKLLKTPSQVLKESLTTVSVLDTGERGLVAKVSARAANKTPGSVVAHVAGLGVKDTINDISVSRFAEATKGIIPPYEVPGIGTIAKKEIKSHVQTMDMPDEGGAQAFIDSIYDDVMEGSGEAMPWKEEKLLHSDPGNIRPAHRSAAVRAEEVVRADFEKRGIATEWDIPGSEARADKRTPAFRDAVEKKIKEFEKVEAYGKRRFELLQAREYSTVPEQIAEETNAFDEAIRAGKLPGPAEPFEDFFSRYKSRGVMRWQQIADKYAPTLKGLSAEERAVLAEALNARETVGVMHGIATEPGFASATVGNNADNIDRALMAWSIEGKVSREEALLAKHAELLKKPEVRALFSEHQLVRPIRESVTTIFDGIQSQLKDIDAPSKARVLLDYAAKRADIIYQDAMKFAAPLAEKYGINPHKFASTVKGNYLLGFARSMTEKLPSMKDAAVFFKEASLELNKRARAFGYYYSSLPAPLKKLLENSGRAGLESGKFIFKSMNFVGTIDPLDTLDVIMDEGLKYLEDHRLTPAQKHDIRARFREEMNTLQQSKLGVLARALPITPANAAVVPGGDPNKVNEISDEDLKVFISHADNVRERLDIAARSIENTSGVERSAALAASMTGEVAHSAWDVISEFGMSLHRLVLTGTTFAKRELIDRPEIKDPSTFNRLLEVFDDEDVKNFAIHNSYLGEKYMRSLYAALKISDDIRVARKSLLAGGEFNPADFINVNRAAQYIESDEAKDFANKYGFLAVDLPVMVALEPYIGAFTAAGYVYRSAQTVYAANQLRNLPLNASFRHTRNWVRDNFSGGVLTDKLVHFISKADRATLPKILVDNFGFRYPGFLNAADTAIQRNLPTTAEMLGLPWFRPRGWDFSPNSNAVRQQTMQILRLAESEALKAIKNSEPMVEFFKTASSREMVKFFAIIGSDKGLEQFNGRIASGAVETSAKLTKAVQGWLNLRSGEALMRNKIWNKQWFKDLRSERVADEISRYVKSLRKQGKSVPSHIPELKLADLELVPVFDKPAKDYSIRASDGKIHNITDELGKELGRLGKNLEVHSEPGRDSALIKQELRGKNGTLELPYMPAEVAEKMNHEPGRYQVIMELSKGRKEVGMVRANLPTGTKPHEYTAPWGLVAGREYRLVRYLPRKDYRYSVEVSDGKSVALLEDLTERDLDKLLSIGSSDDVIRSANIETTGSLSKLVLKDGSGMDVSSEVAMLFKGNEKNIRLGFEGKGKSTRYFAYDKSGGEFVDIPEKLYSFLKKKSGTEAKQVKSILTKTTGRDYAQYEISNLETGESYPLGQKLSHLVSGLDPEARLTIKEAGIKVDEKKVRYAFVTAKSDAETVHISAKRQDEILKHFEPGTTYKTYFRDVDQEERFVILDRQTDDYLPNINLKVNPFAPGEILTLHTVNNNPIIHVARDIETGAEVVINKHLAERVGQLPFELLVPRQPVLIRHDVHVRGATGDVTVDLPKHLQNVLARLIKDEATLRPWMRGRIYLRAAAEAATGSGDALPLYMRLGKEMTRSKSDAPLKAYMRRVSKAAKENPEELRDATLKWIDYIRNVNKRDIKDASKASYIAETDRAIAEVQASPDTEFSSPAAKQEILKRLHEVKEYLRDVYNAHPDVDPAEALGWLAKTVLYYDKAQRALKDLLLRSPMGAIPYNIFNTIEDGMKGTLTDGFGRYGESATMTHDVMGGLVQPVKEQYPRVKMDSEFEILKKIKESDTPVGSAWRWWSDKADEMSTPAEVVGRELTWKYRYQETMKLLDADPITKSWPIEQKSLHSAQRADEFVQRYQFFKFPHSTASSWAERSNMFFQYYANNARAAVEFTIQNPPMARLYSQIIDRYATVDVGAGGDLIDRDDKSRKLTIAHALPWVSLMRALKKTPGFSPSEEDSYLIQGAGMMASALDNVLIKGSRLGPVMGENVPKLIDIPRAYLKKEEPQEIPGTRIDYEEQRKKERESMANLQKVMLPIDRFTGWAMGVRLSNTADEGFMEYQARVVQAGQFLDGNHVTLPEARKMFEDRMSANDLAYMAGNLYSETGSPGEIRVRQEMDLYDTLASPEDRRAFLNASFPGPDGRPLIEDVVSRPARIKDMGEEARYRSSLREVRDNPSEALELWNRGQTGWKMGGLRTIWETVKHLIPEAGAAQSSNPKQAQQQAQAAAVGLPAYAKQMQQSDEELLKQATREDFQGVGDRYPELHPAVEGQQRGKDWSWFPSTLKSASRGPASGRLRVQMAQMEGALNRQALNWFDGFERLKQASDDGYPVSREHFARWAKGEVPSTIDPNGPWEKLSGAGVFTQKFEVGPYKGRTRAAVMLDEARKKGVEQLDSTGRPIPGMRTDLSVRNAMEMVNYLDSGALPQRTLKNVEERNKLRWQPAFMKMESGVKAPHQLSVASIAADIRADMWQDRPDGPSKKMYFEILTKGDAADVNRVAQFAIALEADTVERFAMTAYGEKRDGSKGWIPERLDLLKMYGHGESLAALAVVTRDKELTEMLEARGVPVNPTEVTRNSMAKFLSREGFFGSINPEQLEEVIQHSGAYLPATIRRLMDPANKQPEIGAVHSWTTPIERLAEPLADPSAGFAQYKPKPGSLPLDMSKIVMPKKEIDDIKKMFSVQVDAQEFRGINDFRVATLKETRAINEALKYAAAAKATELYPELTNKQLTDIMASAPQTNFLVEAARNIQGLPISSVAGATRDIMGIGYSLGLMDYGPVRAVDRGLLQLGTTNAVADVSSFVLAAAGNSMAAMTYAERLKTMRIEATNNLMKPGLSGADLETAKAAHSRTMAYTTAANYASVSGQVLSFGAGISNALGGPEELTQGLGTAGGAAQGFAVGTSILPGWGSLIGAGIGAAVGYFSSTMGREDRDPNSELRRQALAAQRDYYSAARENELIQRSQMEARTTQARASALNSQEAMRANRQQQSLTLGRQLARFMRRPQFSSSQGLVGETEARARRQFTPRF